jgi:hypothetical protein
MLLRQNLGRKSIADIAKGGQKHTSTDQQSQT